MPAFSHAAANSIASNTAITVTVTINVGDTVVVAIGYNAGSAKTVNSVVDSSSANTYSQGGSAGGALGAFIWTSFNVANAATSVTVTMSASCSCISVAVATYSGTFSRLGTTSGSVSGTSGTTITTTESVTDNLQNWGVATHAWQGKVTLTATTGTIRAQSNLPSGTNCSTAIIDSIAANGATTITQATGGGINGSAFAGIGVELRNVPLFALPRHRDGIREGHTVVNF